MKNAPKQSKPKAVKVWALFSRDGKRMIATMRTRPSLFGDPERRWIQVEVRPVPAKRRKPRGKK